MTSEERIFLSSILRDALATAKSIPAETAALEAQLSRTKWFDYRFMSPWEATSLFASAYQQVFKEKWSLNWSTVDAPKKIAIRRNSWSSSPRETISVWKARQVADALGAPYDWFCREALEALLRDGWTRQPRPNQLYSEKTLPRIVDRVSTSWSEWCREGPLQFSKLPQYRVESYVGLPVQDDHFRWLVEQLRYRHGRPGAIGQLCLMDRVLPEQLAIDEFGPERMHSAHVAVVGLFVSSTPSQPVTFKPGCFGVVHASQPNSAPCSGCSEAKSCHRIAKMIETRVHAECGSDDPVAARRRRLSRERVRRHRAKARASMSATH